MRARYLSVSERARLLPGRHPLLKLGDRHFIELEAPAHRVRARLEPRLFALAPRSYQAPQTQPR